MLRRWIDQGAHWPEDLSAAKKHWAYVKPVRPSCQRSKGNLAEKPHRLLRPRPPRKGKLKPSPEADRATLLRRVSLDLTGLPPTLEEVEAFLADKSPDAYEKAVDRLLASPAYGERWARPWLDLARYADTQGYEKDNRRTIWPYRDWVISALNRNLPFDQFTIEQIAGDLLPERDAGSKGRHRLSSQHDDQHRGRHRQRGVSLRGRGGSHQHHLRRRGWARTMACAQCHNHKYDPFTTVEYYRIMAFLNSTEDADYDDERPTVSVFEARPRGASSTGCATPNVRRRRNSTTPSDTPEFATALAEWETKINAEKTAWETLDPTEFKSEGGATLRKNNTKSILAEGANPTNDTYVVTAPIGRGRFTGIRLEVLETGSGEGAGPAHQRRLRACGASNSQSSRRARDAAKPAEWKSVSADFSQKDFEVTQHADRQRGRLGGRQRSKPENRVRRSAYFTLGEPLDLPEGGDADVHPRAQRQASRREPPALPALRDAERARRPAHKTARTTSAPPWPSNPRKTRQEADARR